MSETVLLVGGGGREHAIARALEGSDCELYACAGNRNPGIDRIAAGFETFDTTNTSAVTTYAEEVGATLAVIGPEAPLQAGVADALSDAGVFPFGPSAEGAKIETDKAYQRRFMREHDIPGCPEFETFESTEDACAYIDSSEADLAVKPAGLTGGKGVKVIGDQVDKEGAKAYLREETYDRVVLEERFVGEEFTVQGLVANGSLRVTPAVQDHKRAYEGDEGPNTGGMGSYSDAGLELPFLTEDEYRDAVGILDETVAALGDYTGVLYGQFMLTADGVKVIEYNARFGDPEAMNTLPVMNTDFLDVLVAAREGEDLPQLSFAPRATVCKYAVPEGYPDDPQGGTPIEVDEETVAQAASATVETNGDARLFYASVDSRDDGVYTTTSRAFAVVGIAETISEAEGIAERALSNADEGVRIRHDIGTEELVQSRIDHAAELRGE
ncbi:phosphoribosylamine--glycine ligase [Halalkalicoccus jeotgali]|uniref:Phosphoribosylamine--glycine ligase n=1 Tax=Halalkalicoccus jeotgali (strain DSM 18796 / CECT 7217 / JCM 14584 / KCTC 4019 / B3) TaxID=795797 RepID=D8J2J8_HALJB|nr:phosphoribosylamine--glycine ligase [Halalkalicoccus jeotgali]ADJ14955.1 phosphoribosylamine--glycine ligase [Halalkalicoccus jeotgali B3]ELY35029.1 phosphoribosylamine--glycine ligase [Halalkalicoccus jeotgali B3]